MLFFFKWVNNCSKGGSKWEIGRGSFLNFICGAPADQVEKFVDDVNTRELLGVVEAAIEQLEKTLESGNIIVWVSEFRTVRADLPFEPSWATLSWRCFTENECKKRLTRCALTGAS
eukprot:6487348-Amphidinium_carterae.1